MASPFDLVTKLNQVRGSTGAAPPSVDQYAPQADPLAKLKGSYSAGTAQAGPAGGDLTAEQVADLVYDMGATDPEAVARLVAIARRESGFKSGAYNGNRATNDDSHGLWQINTLAGANPKYASWNLKDPKQNARAMWELSGGGKNLRPWAMYDDGRARYSGYEIDKYMGEARAAAQAAARRRGLVR